MFTTLFLDHKTNAEPVPHTPIRTARFSNKNRVIGIATGVRIPGGGLLSSTEVHIGFTGGKAVGASSSSYLHLESMLRMRWTTLLLAFTTSRRVQGKAIFYFMFLTQTSQY
jgi:hypothetical protein